MTNFYIDPITNPNVESNVKTPIKKSEVSVVSKGVKNFEESDVAKSVTENPSVDKVIGQSSPKKIVDDVVCEKSDT